MSFTREEWLKKFLSLVHSGAQVSYYRCLGITKHDIKGYLARIGEFTEELEGLLDDRDHEEALADPENEGANISLEAMQKLLDLAPTHTAPDDDYDCGGLVNLDGPDFAITDEDTPETLAIKLRDFCEGKGKNDHTLGTLRPLSDEQMKALSISSEEFEERLEEGREAAGGPKPGVPGFYSAEPADGEEDDA